MSIRTIPSEVCQRICTGQVVVTLSGACKELLDNALDAQATTIEIRAKSFGFDSLEVIDDGTGIRSEDFDSLCKPHSTSKLTDFEDFRQLSTFGFRGEALNALCSVSSVTITTRHATEQTATKLHFNHFGSIESTEMCARPVGTTVLINNLFETLPVRRRELERTARKEFCKLLNAVQSFALSRTDVRFSASSISNGKRHQALLTPGGNASIKDVIVSLFGARSDKNSVLDIVRCEPDEEICKLYGISSNIAKAFENIQIGGYVSSCLHGHGRSSADRQFVYFNHRPVDYSKLCRIANEVYQQYNVGQYCMLILLIDVPSDCIDVNISPDKRCVFFEREKELFALVRSSLLATFAPILGHIEGIRSSSQKEDDGEQSPPENETAAVKASVDNEVVNYGPIGEDDDLPGVSTQSFRIIFETPGSQVGPPTTVTFCSDKRLHPAGMPVTDDESSRKRPAEPLEKFKKAIAQSEKRPAAKRVEDLTHHGFSNDPSTSRIQEKSTKTDSRPSPLTVMLEDVGVVVQEHMLDCVVQRATKSDLFALPIEVDQEVAVDLERVSPCPSAVSAASAGGVSSIANPVTCPDDDIVNRLKSETNLEQVNMKGSIIRTQQKVAFSVDDLTRRMNEVHSRGAPAEPMGQTSSTRQSLFSAFNSRTAEKELSANITKKDFDEMQVVGQFNKGFIIARLRGELFIIDQHASDEKFNFEKFQKKARIQSQALLSPQTLDIGAVEEAVLRDNIEVFNYNGFEFAFDDKKNPGKRVMLTSVPVLHNWQFNTSDIDEMISVLTEFPGTMYRPAKLRKLFASRACRKSVMIGTAINVPKMEKIIRHLSELDHPWNCPHGRPTLRHLWTLGVGLKENQTLEMEDSAKSDNMSIED